MFCFVVRQNWSQEQIERPWSISVTSATTILICKDVCSIYSLKSVGSSRVLHFTIWNANSDRYYRCFRLFFDSKFRAGGTGFAGGTQQHFQIWAKVDIKPVGL